jgi:hypothetical protein
MTHSRNVLPWRAAVLFILRSSSEEKFRMLRLVVVTDMIHAYHTIQQGSIERAKTFDWGARGVPVRTIHKSPETTVKYLGITNLDSLTVKKHIAAVRRKVVIRRRVPPTNPQRSPKPKAPFAPPFLASTNFRMSDRSTRSPARRMSSLTIDRASNPCEIWSFAALTRRRHEENKHGFSRITSGMNYANWDLSYVDGSRRLVPRWTPIRPIHLTAQGTIACIAVLLSYVCTTDVAGNHLFSL